MKRNLVIIISRIMSAKFVFDSLLLLFAIALMFPSRWMVIEIVLLNGNRNYAGNVCLTVKNDICNDVPHCSLGTP